MDSTWDVIIIGGGAAGLIAAGRAASLGATSLLLEKNRKLGVKILMSGGTRCNVTHDCGPREIANAIGDAKGRFLYPALGEFPPSAIIQLLRDQGVSVKVEATGKVFPTSDRASDVRDALVRWAESQGAILRPGSAVSDLPPSEAAPNVSDALSRTNRPAAGRFTVRVEGSPPQSAKTVILATGGQSYPGCGTTGDGYRWARSLGHTIVPPVPALTPIRSNDTSIHELAGVTLPRAGISVVAQSSSKQWTTLARDVNALLFTHFGFSGPGVLNVSRVVSGHHAPTSLLLQLDLAPDLSAEAIDSQLQAKEMKSGGRTLASAVQLVTELPRRVVLDQLRRVEVDATLPLAELTRPRRMAIVRQLKTGRYPITGVAGFKKAEVTAGGIELSEVDRRTMHSRVCPGLFLAGEILDLDGPIGGFNFQCAFSTGWLAATSAVEYSPNSSD